MDQKILPALGKVPVGRLDAVTLDCLYSELRQHGSRCQHCYRWMRDGQPPMRPGEVCSVRWSDVDLDRGEILVAGSVIILPGQPRWTER